MAGHYSCELAVDNLSISHTLSIAEAEIVETTQREVGAIRAAAITEIPRRCEDGDSSSG